VLSALGLVTVLASAQPAEAAAAMAEPAAQQDAGELAEVRQLYDEGKAKFDTYDYPGAVDLWTKAYAKLEVIEGNREIRNNLVYNIATAQEKAYDLNGDVAHLKQARALLQRYVDEYKALYKPTPEGREEVAKVEARIQELDDRIAGAQQSGPVETPEEDRPPTARELERERDRQVKEILRNDPEISPEYRSGKGMVTGGAVALAIGGTFAFSALALWPVTTPGSTGRASVIAVTSLGGATAIAGAVLVGLGVPKRRRATQKARDKAATMTAQGPSARVVVSPTLSAEMLGLQVGGRF
jgi:hypothetical protein